MPRGTISTKFPNLSTLFPRKFPSRNFKIFQWRKCDEARAQRAINWRKASVQVWRIRGVMQETGLSRTTIYRQTKSGDFPSPIRIGKCAIGWISSDVEEWIKTRPTATAYSKKGGEK
ncbi:MAG: AlpA family phage regulatory protein [Nitrospinae bacterium]|nr:AlpA family phage regulatory protein [Nitrospinota bacterium]MBF0633117.1 AlpA family phage regulatory protein [Nitrospinota bacterium]